jgi:hypothetical protein
MDETPSLIFMPKTIHPIYRNRGSIYNMAIEVAKCFIKIVPYSNDINSSAEILNHN